MIVGRMQQVCCDKIVTFSVSQHVTTNNKTKHGKSKKNFGSVRFISQVRIGSYTIGTVWMYRDILGFYF